MKLEFPFAVPVHTHWHPSEDEYRARMSAISQILERVAFSGARHFSMADIPRSELLKILLRDYET